MIHTHNPHMRRHQRGATLLISLIMLVVLTLFAVTGFNLSSVNLKIAGNFQAQRGMEAAAQQAIEQVLSTAAAFSLAPAAQTVTVSGFNVGVSAATCNYVRTASGYGKDIEALAPEDTDWQVGATVTDTLTGAQANITQGVLIRLPKGNCP